MMTPDPDIPPRDSALLEQYLAPESSSGDQESVQRVRQSLLARRQVALRNGYRSGGRSRPSAPARRTWAGLVGGVSVAAVAIVGAVSFWHHQTPHPSDSGSRVYTTAPRQQAAITLPDGTHAILAPATALRYTEASDGSRNVSINGQAVFTVVESASRPFLVVGGDITTRVLGTEFDVQSYASDSSVIVGVRSGRVALHGATGQMMSVLSAGMLATYQHGDVRVDSVGSDNAAGAWSRGQLIFRKTPVPAFLKTLERWYGYEFRLADSLLARQHVTTVLAVDRPQETMQVLKDLLEVSMTFRGDTVILQRRHETGTTQKTPVMPKPAVAATIF